SPYADTVAPDNRTDAWAAMPVPALRIGEAPLPYDLGSAEPDMAALRPLGQVGNTFIVASGPQGLLVLDQHAAHESVLYEQLIDAEPSSLEPAEAFILHLSVGQSHAVTRLQPVLATLGFQLEPFGRDTVLVRAVPAVLHALLRPGNLLEACQEAAQRATPQ